MRDHSSILTYGGYPRELLQGDELPRIDDDFQQGLRWLAWTLVAASAASEYVARSLQLYIQEHGALATHLRCRSTGR